MGAVSWNGGLKWRLACGILDTVVRVRLSGRVTRSFRLIVAEQAVVGGADQENRGNPTTAAGRDGSVAGDRYRAAYRPEMLPFIPERRATLLEIGCGEGRFAASIPGVSEAWGVEPDPHAAAAAGSRLFRVVQAPFEIARDQLPRNHFDVVVCNDVIEHLTDHDRFFEDIKGYLSDGGVLVASLPNVRFYRNLIELIFARDWEYRDSGILDRTHLRFFTERSLRRTLGQHGYSTEKFEGINSGFWFGWSKWGVVSAIFSYGLIIASLGKAVDIKFQQFAFRAAPTSPTSAATAPAGPPLGK